MVAISFLKCAFCYSYINILGVGLFIASNDGFVYRWLQVDSVCLVDKALSLCSCTFVRLDMVNFHAKLFYCDY